MCTPEAHIIHLQQAMCSMIKAMKMHFMDWLATQTLKKQRCLTGWALQVTSTVKNTNENL